MVIGLSLRMERTGSNPAGCIFFETNIIRSTYLGFQEILIQIGMELRLLGNFLVYSDNFGKTGMSIKTIVTTS